jgi:transglutaminase-like putative cysteine protease
MDLTRYIAKGFPGGIDHLIATVPVIGIDREQVQSAVRLCAETERALYSTFSPSRIRYRLGSRPKLEPVVATFRGATPKARMLQAMHWVSEHVVHPHFIGPLPADRNFSEEQLIESRCGWCNEQVRVFIALCEVMELPARLCFLWHENGKTGHTASEVFIDGRWAFVDVTFAVTVERPDRRLAEARELSREHRQAAHDAYALALPQYYARTKRYVTTVPGWNPDDRPKLDRGGDLLGYIGIVNYLIDGVEADAPRAK